MAYGGFKDLVRRAASDKVLCDKAFNIAKIPKYDRYKEVLLLCFINFLTNYAGIVPLTDKKRNYNY